MVNYIDDFWVHGEDFDSSQKAQLELVDLLSWLGFSVAWDKCTSPSQQCTYLGLCFNSQNMTISLPHDKVLGLQRR